MRKWLAATIISILLAYGAGTVVFTARDLGRTWDERLYTDAGLIYLQQHHFAENHDHPPLSKWLAALYPYYSGNHSDEAFRYSHAVIYTVGGGIMAFQLLAWGYSFAAVIFAALFFLCPNLKAMASLNVLDADLAVWMGLAALYTWRGFSERAAGRMGFLQGLAAMTKISGLCYVPFFALRVRRLRSRRATWMAVAGFFLAGLFSYHFRFIELGAYAASLGLQWKHGLDGHGIFLLGQYSSRGYWYTYIVLYFLKNPFPSLVVMLTALIFLARRPSAYRDAIVYWFAPAALMFALLSVGTVQLGFRYVLPAMVLLYLTTALVLDRELRIAPPTRRTLGAALLGFLGLALLIADMRTVSDSTYLAYFNDLAPNPTRNFSDSNIDWLQGIPRHLVKRIPPFTPLGDLTAAEVFSRPDNEPVSIALGATDIHGGWGGWFPERMIGPAIGRNGKTIWSGAGYEIVQVSREELCKAWRENDAASHSDVLVVSRIGSSFSQPSWIDGTGKSSQPHPFLVDGKPEFHRWRGWIPVDVINSVRFVDSAGKALDSGAIVRARCD